MISWASDSVMMPSFKSFSKKESRKVSIRPRDREQLHLVQPKITKNTQNLNNIYCILGLDLETSPFNFIVVFIPLFLL